MEGWAEVLVEWADGKDERTADDLVDQIRASAVADRVSKMRVRSGDLLLVYTDDPDSYLDALDHVVPDGVQVIFVPLGTEMKAFDEETMKECGWIRRRMRMKK